MEDGRPLHGLTRRRGRTDALQDSFRTIEAPATTELRIERSRFLGNAFRAASRDNAETIYSEIQRRYHDATHNCYAYRVGLDSNSFTRYSDDGEPAGTAGRPILEAIDSAVLTNVMVVVTRYFGGVKLGTGGLARAYRDTATATLKEARIVEELIYQYFKLAFDHDDTSIVMHLLSESGIRPAQTEYAESVIITARIRQSQFEALQNQLLNRSRGRARIEPFTRQEEDEI